MALLVDGALVDVGFGAPTPVGPVPVGGEATYGTHNWNVEAFASPEGEDAWLVKLGDMPLYSFTELPRHPIDFRAPNYFTSTHPGSIYKQTLIVQRWTHDLVQVGLVGRTLLVRNPYTETSIELVELDGLLSDVFHLRLDGEDMAALCTRLTEPTP